MFVERIRNEFDSVSKRVIRSADFLPEDFRLTLHKSTDVRVNKHGRLTTILAGQLCNRVSNNGIQILQHNYRDNTVFVTIAKNDRDLRSSD